MSTTAFPVRQTSEGVGCTDIALRKIFGALYPDKGIITGLTVKGGNTLSYTVAEGVAVCSKGDADGSTLAYYEGGSVDVSANSSSNPRIDVVWITSHDVTQGDEDNLVAIGVTEGKAAATPVEPDIPSYATKIGSMQMAGGATTTSSATQYGSASQVVPYGGANGLMFNGAINFTGQWGKEGTEQGLSNFSFYLSTKRIIQIGITITAGAVNGRWTADGDGSVYSCIRDNGSGAASASDPQGEILDRREIRIHKVGNAVSQYYMFTCELDAGYHNLILSYQPQTCDALYFYYSKNAYAGQRIDVVDLGIAD